MSDDPDRRLSGSEFLERQLYRRRRVIDALKLLPLIGAALFVLPAVMLGEQAGSTGTRLIYFFSVWFGLIIVCAVLVRLLQRPDGQ